MAEQNSLERHFNESNTARYLEALNDALQEHPYYQKPMQFSGINVKGETLYITVLPQGVCRDKNALKAFKDMANILTIRGITLKYEIIDVVN